MTDKLKHVQIVLGRHYLRYKTFRDTLLADPGTPAYLAEYQIKLATLVAKSEMGEEKHKAAVAERKKKQPSGERARAGTTGSGETIDEAVLSYLESPAFRRREDGRGPAAPATQRGRRHYLDLWRNLPGTAKGQRVGRALIKDLTRPMIRNMVGRQTHGTGKNMLVAIRTLMRYRIDNDLMVEDADPTIRVESPLNENPDGHKEWKRKHIEQFREHYPVGTQARTALELMRRFGPAAVDVIKLGWENVEVDEEIGEVLRYTRQKTKRYNAVAINPFLPEAEAFLFASGYDRNWKGPWLRNSQGQPFTNKVFTQWFGRMCADADLPEGYTAHGVRKFFANDLAENGYSTIELRIAGGWLSDAEPNFYTRRVDQRKVTRSAYRKQVKNAPKLRVV